MTVTPAKTGRALPASFRWVIFLAVLALAGWVGTFIVKQFVATALLAYGETSASRERAVEAAPSNPLVQAAQGKYLLYRAAAPEPAAGLAALERAVVASPFDYRFWLELGRGYAADNQTAAAERALRQALQLAPRYFETHWALANFYLRVDRAAEALPVFRQALELAAEPFGSEAQAVKARAALNTYEVITQALGLNLDALRQVTPPDAHAQAALAKFLADHGAFEVALATFNALSAEAQRGERAALESLLAAAQLQRRFREARALWLNAEQLEAAAAQPLIFNAGFERAFSSLPNGFDWWLAAPHAEVRVRRDDAQPHTGRYALRLTFAAQMQSELQSYSQLLVVAPQTRYRLRFWVKTAKAPERGPFLELTDAVNPQLFALRAALPSGTQGWQEQALVFTTPAESHGLRLGLRAPQLLDVNTGNITEIWLDDFSLEALP